MGAEMGAETADYLAIALIGAVTLFARFAGATIMSQIGLSPRIEAFLNGLAVAVMVAVVVAFLARNGAREFAAVAVAILTFLAARNMLLAMGVAVALAAGWRALAA